MSRSSITVSDSSPPLGRTRGNICVLWWSPCRPQSDWDLGARPPLQLICFHGERIQKFAGSLGMEQSRSYRIIFHQPRQHADTDQVIIDQLLRNADHENQAGARSVCAKRNAGPTAPNAENDLIDQIGACMWERDTVFDHAWVCLLPREHLFEKSFRLVDFAIVHKQLNDLTQRVWHFAGAQPQDYLLFIEKIN